MKKDQGVSQLKTIRLIIFGMFLVCNVAYAEMPPPTPIPKVGSCPFGYSNQGNFCIPSSGAKFAIIKNGSCPFGYSTNYNYCLAEWNARYAMPKGDNASCPFGYSNNYNYCVSNK